MTTFYLAARYIRREELLRYKADLEAAGHTVTSRWLAGNHQWDSSGSVARDYEAGGTSLDALRFAQEDVEDLKAASVVISFTEVPRETFSHDDAYGLLIDQRQVMRSVDDEAEWLTRELNRMAGKSSRGGRHVEFGMALALNKRVIVVGPRENVFHLLPGVAVCESWEECLEDLEWARSILDTPGTQMDPPPPSWVEEYRARRKMEREALPGLGYHRERPH